MRFRDFSITPGCGRPDRGRYSDWRLVASLTFPFEQEFFFELRARPPIDAPFAKLLICTENLVRANPQQPATLLDVLEVWLGVREVDLIDDEERRLSALCDAVDEALDLIDQHYGWKSVEASDIVRTLRERERLGWIELRRFTKKLSEGRTVRVFYEASSDHTAVYAVFFDGEAEVRRECIARSDSLLDLDSLFPVRSVAHHGSTFELRDSSGATLTVVDVER